MKKTFCLTLLAGLSSIMNYSQTHNVGIDTSAPGSKLTVNGSFAATYKTVTSSSLVDANDYYIAYNGNSNGTLTLPAAIAGEGNFIGRTYHFKNTGSAVLTIATNGAELIDNQSGSGVPNISVPPGYYAFFISKGTTTGTTWELILLSSSNGVPAAATTYPFSAISTTTRQSLPATIGAGPYVTGEINYAQGAVINAGGAFNTGSGRFTAPDNGYYMFYGSTQFDNGAVSGNPTFAWNVLYLIKNYSTTPNNILVQSHHINSGPLSSTNVSCITYLNAGETVSMASAAAVSSGTVYQVVVSTLYGHKIAN
ncbi:hypothetical protein [Chryseobacterium populi]|uniref:C1q domain containing protein n=1 Tax=Chryseobacterium populi TaxID=1144316 RepID=J3CE45_9FLAO|nr:hypothetical protein [Chryseobacterium populi]EJL69616.1 C1q domain containing protein [Chryseobacterium populi]